MSVTKQLLLQKNGNKRSKGAATAANGVDWKGFVACELTSGHKDDLASGAMPAGEAWEIIDQLLWTGYKLSVTCDAQHDCYIVSLTCRRQDDPNAGYTLTARGGDMTNAVRSLAYKHDKVTDGNWEQFVHESAIHKTKVDFG